MEIISWKFGEDKDADMEEVLLEERGVMLEALIL
jgi:hypothetical protein